MIKINLMPKKEKPITIERLQIKQSAYFKRTLFYADKLIENQDRIIYFLKSLLRLRGVDI